MCLSQMPLVSSKITHGLASKILQARMHKTYQMCKFVNAAYFVQGVEGFEIFAKGRCIMEIAERSQKISQYNNIKATVIPPPVKGCRILNESPSKRAPGVVDGAAGMLLLFIVLMFPFSIADMIYTWEATTFSNNESFHHQKWMVLFGLVHPPSSESQCYGLDRTRLVQDWPE